MILFASASEIARMLVSRHCDLEPHRRARASGLDDRPGCSRRRILAFTPPARRTDATMDLLLPSQERGVIRRSRKEKTMSMLAQRPGSFGARALPGGIALAFALTFGGVAAARADEPTLLRVNA